MRFMMTFALVAAMAVASFSQALAADLVVYSARNEQLITPLIERFENETGIEVEFVTDKAGALVARLQAEGAATPADVLITVDAGNLWQAEQLGLFRSIASDVLAENVPTDLRSPDNFWFGLSIRARTIVYHDDRVNPEELTGYAGLADPKWNDRLCLRTSKKVYNQSLVAMLIAEYGADKTADIVKGWVDNLAVQPTSSDTKALEAILAGACDVSVVNTYYLGRLLKKNPDAPLSVFWPDQGGIGVHENISGAGVLKHARHPEAAKKFIEWLSEGEAQRIFADANMEYPVKPGVAVNDLIKEWGAFDGSDVNVSVYGKRQAEATVLMDKAGYR